MSEVSLLNDVLGPVMRGPSSSHTAGPFFIGRAVRDILGRTPAEAAIFFDPAGSFARVYRDQRSDLGFAAGLLGLPITDPDFAAVLTVAPRQGLRLTFAAQPIPGADHPNAVLIEALAADGRRRRITAASIGGGQIRLDRLDDTPVAHDGRRPRLLLVAAAPADPLAEAARLQPAPQLRLFANAADPSGRTAVCEGDEAALRSLADRARAAGTLQADLLPATALPVQHAPPWSLDSVASVIAAAGPGGRLSQVGLRYEARLLGLTEAQAAAEMGRRWTVMADAVADGLRGAAPALPLRFLTPTAAGFMQAGRDGRLLCGGLLGVASAAALAVMEINSTGGVVCAAPTAGSAGVIPGLLYAMRQERHVATDRLVDALWAMGVVGAMVAERATFAAEVCGCAAEVGVAAAMAAAGLAELAGAALPECLEAATLALMNSLGLVCDPVQGAVEIPCHARNLGAVAQALVAAEAVRGGFRPGLPLDEVIDCLRDVGRQLPATLRCTSLGGLAATPTARRL